MFIILGSHLFFSSVMSGIRRMSPLTELGKEEERVTVSELEREGWRVGFYLAGRRIMDSEAERSRPESGKMYRRHPVIHGPLLITKNAAKEDLPVSNELWDHTKKAMAAFDTLN
jgi:hypothetical protein